MAATCPWRAPCLALPWASSLYELLLQGAVYLVGNLLHGCGRVATIHSNLIAFCLLADTPGVHLHHRVQHMLSPEELKLLHPRKRLLPCVPSSPSQLSQQAATTATETDASSPGRDSAGQAGRAGAEPARAGARAGPAEAPDVAQWMGPAGQQGHPGDARGGAEGSRAQQAALRGNAPKKVGGGRQSGAG